MEIPTIIVGIWWWKWVLFALTQVCAVVLGMILFSAYIEYEIDSTSHWLLRLLWLIWTLFGQAWFVICFWAATLTGFVYIINQSSCSSQ